MLKIINLTKTFKADGKSSIAFRNVSFEVKKDEFLTIVGPSGCGKSTLLRVISDLASKTSGQVEWEKPPKIGFVFQNFALFPYLTVEENIEFGLKMNGVKKEMSSVIVKELIEEVGLSGFAQKHPKELSGGMKQRVGIARALAISPDVLMLDEPFSSLDEFTAETLRKLLLQLWQKRGVMVIMVTHLIREALELSDQVVVMTPHPGTVEKVVENSLPRPRNLRSEEFFKMEDKLTELVRA